METYTQPIALIDMDGVLADFDTEVKTRVAARHPEISLLDPLPEPCDFYVARHYPTEHHATVRAISNEERFFASLPVIPHAIEGWQRVMEAGFKPQICSSPISSNPYSKQEKLEWLEEHFAPVFGSWIIDSAIITRDKHLVSGAVLVDDRPAIHGAEQASWTHVIFDQPCNRAVIEQPRIQGWDDPHLESILQNAVKLVP